MGQVPPSWNLGLPYFSWLWSESITQSYLCYTTLLGVGFAYVCSKLFGFLKSLICVTVHWSILMSVMMECFILGGTWLSCSAYFMIYFGRFSVVSLIGSEVSAVVQIYLQHSLVRSVCFEVYYHLVVGSWSVYDLVRMASGTTLVQRDPESSYFSY